MSVSPRTRVRSLYAERWAGGRAFLAGGAARQMPPFLAQGLCSGLRDVHNLSWKLYLVLRGLASEGRLETYAEERGATRAVDDRREHPCGPDRRRARAGEDPPTRRRPAGAPSRKAVDQRREAAHRLPRAWPWGRRHRTTRGAGRRGRLPRRRVRRDGHGGRANDIVGRGYPVPARRDPFRALDPEDLAFFASLAGQLLRIVPDGTDAAAPAGLVDVEGAFARLFDLYGCEVILKRPDHYLVSTAQGVDDLPSLLADLKEQLRTNAGAIAG